MASFAVLKSNLSLHWDVKYTDNVQHNFQRENNKGLLFTMSWSGPLCSCSFSRFSHEMLSLQWGDGDWGRSPPSPQAFITSSSLYKWRIWFPSPPRRGRWFLALASPRYEIQASILSKNFLEKIINLRVINELASFRKSHMTAPYFPSADFVTKTLQISWKLKGSGPKVATEVGGEWLGSPSESPSPLQGILLFASFSLVIGDLGCFINAKCPSWCSPSFWSSHSHPGMATFCCSGQKAASAAQFGRLREFKGDMSPEQQNTDHHAKHHPILFLSSNSLL